MKYRVKGPDGHTYTGTAPDNATDAQIIEHIMASPAYRDAQMPTPKVASTEAPTPLLSQIGRQVGLTARAGVNGVLSLPAMIGDALGMHSTDAVNYFLSTIGLPKPETKTEEFAQNVAGGMAGAIVPLGLGERLEEMASPVARGIGKILHSQPGAQVVGGGTGNAASSLAASMGAGPLGQTVAGLAGGSLAFVPGESASVARRALRGSAKGAPEAVKTARRFSDLEVPASPAQVFGSGPLQAVESYFTLSPGGHKTMRSFAERQASALGRAASRAADELDAKGTPILAGRAIEEGVTGPGGFMDRFHDTSKELFDKVDEYVPQDAIASVNHTEHVLASISKPTPGAETVSRLLVNPKITEIRAALSKDIEQSDQGGLPYYALKELRSRVGEMIGSPQLTSEIPRRQLKALYGAITEDMKSTVEVYGGKAGMRAFNRANNYVRAGHARIDQILQPILNRNVPERVFMAATSGMRNGDTVVHSIMQSLPSGQQRMVASTVLRSLGTARPGAQNAEGDLFSVNTFLTNWAGMSDGAKRSLFSRFGKGYVDNLNKIAKVAQDIKQAGSIYANPSGTAPAFTLQSTIGGAVIAALTGHLHIAGGIAGENALSHMAARRILDPSFTAWLAKYATLPVAALPVALNQLSQPRN